MPREPRETDARCLRSSVSDRGDGIRKFEKHITFSLPVVKGSDAESVGKGDSKTRKVVSIESPVATRAVLHPPAYLGIVNVLSKEYVD